MPLTTLRHYVTGAIERGERKPIVERRAPGFNCKHGSAWHDWQMAGHHWRSLNINATTEQTSEAAVNFAAVETSSIGQSARQRAFMECAN